MVTKKLWWSPKLTFEVLVVRVIRSCVDIYSGSRVPRSVMAVPSGRLQLSFPYQFIDTVKMGHCVYFSFAINMHPTTLDIYFPSLAPTYEKKSAMTNNLWSRQVSMLERKVISFHNNYKQITKSPKKNLNKNKSVIWNRNLFYLWPGT